MKWLGKLIALTYDLLLGGITGLAIFLLFLMIGVQFGALGWFFVPASCLIYYVSILAHEMGHLLAALLAGLCIFEFGVWPVRVVRSGKNLCLMRFDMPFPWLGKIVPLANLLIAITSFAILYALPTGKPSISAVAALLLIVASVNAFLFFANLRPRRTKKFYADGAQLLDLIRHPRLVTQNWLAGALSRASQSGLRPRELNAELIDFLLAKRDGSAQDAMSNFFAYYYFLDRGEINHAGDLIDLMATCREKYNAHYQFYAVLEKAYFEARHRHEALEARRWLDQASQGTVEQQTRLRAEAAVLLAEGRHKEAAEKAIAGLDVLPQSADPGGAIAEKEWLESILTECRRRIAE
jgi:hypothetical protein